MDRSEQLAATVAIGKVGWLFHRDDATVEQVTGFRAYSPQVCQMWKYTVESRWAWLRHKGIRYYFLIVPEKHVIYQDMLPSGIVISEDRPAASLLRSLRASDCRCR